MLELKYDYHSIEAGCDEAGIFKEKAMSKPSGKWDPVGKRKFEKRFVMEELEKAMGWKSSGVPVLDLKVPQIGMAAFIHVDRTSLDDRIRFR